VVPGAARDEDRPGDRAPGRVTTARLVFGAGGAALAANP
jgi:hypothetical protein